MENRKILNLGCGHSHIDGADNVDTDEALAAPGFCFDIRRRFPLEDDTYDEVCFFHTIEHIEKKYHRQMLAEVWRILKEDGDFYIAYPEFARVAQCWIENKRGQREFWENTIYGRQLTPSDFHVSIMDSESLRQELQILGFYKIEIHAETPPGEYNSIVKCKKGDRMLTYEQVLYDEVIAH